MSIAAKISPTELREQVLARFTDAHLEARLIYSPGVSYTPGTTVDSNFLTFEVPFTGGYERQIISWAANDVSAYTDNGVGLTTRATTFTQDGSSNTIQFSHVALVWSGGNVNGLVAVPAANPTSGVDGTYTNIPVDSTSASGTGMTIDLTIQNSGALSTDWTASINRSGRGYVAGEVVTFTEGTLTGIGAVPQGAGDLTFAVDTVVDQPNEGEILAVAETSGIASLSSGNQAVFYWNLKQFGFYSVSGS